MNKIKIIRYSSMVIILGLLCGTQAGLAVPTDPVARSQTIDVQTAHQIASMKLHELNQASHHTIESLVDIITSDDIVLCYVFTLEPCGFIIITAHPDLSPVFAYSLYTEYLMSGFDHHIFQSFVQMNLLNRLTHRYEMPEHQLKRHHMLWNAYGSGEYVLESERHFQQWPSSSATDYGGWLETTWSQGAPYNQFCPMDLGAGVRSVAGCPAVAMAQILNYHQTTNNIIFTDDDDYYHNYEQFFWIDNDHATYDFPSFPELNNYLATLSTHYQQQIPLTDDDVAALNFACGVAAHQVYTATVSGTFGVNQALQAYERFGFDDVELLDQYDPDVFERIQDNMMDGLPAHLAVVNDAWTVGHNLVIDGYNTDDYYHLNFGWGGAYDGWYLLFDKLPYDLTVLEGVIVDIMDVYDDSNLIGTGALNWANVKPGRTVTGSFSIENIGTPGQGIDWEIVEHPAWGTWTFTPASGLDLTPEDGPLPIEVSVVVPDERNTHFAGHVTVASTENPTDYCVIHISVTTPRNMLFEPVFLRFLHRHPHLFPILQMVLDKMVKQ